MRGVLFYAVLCTFLGFVGLTQAMAQEASSGESNQAPQSVQLSSDPQAPGYEYNRGITIGTGAQRLIQRRQYALGGGTTEQGSVMRLHIERDMRYAAFSVDTMMGAPVMSLGLADGNPVLRIQGQVQVLPVNIVFTSLGSNSTGATFFNFQIVPTIRGRFTLDDTSGAIGSSNIGFSADLVAHFLRLTMAQIGGDQGGESPTIRLLSVQVIAGFGGGVAHNSSEGANAQIGPHVRIVGRVMLSMGRALGRVLSLDLGLNGHGLIYNLAPQILATEAAQATGNQAGLGGHIGIVAGIPTGPNGFIRAQAEADAEFHIPALGSEPGPLIQAPTRYVGAAIGATF